MSDDSSKSTNCRLTDGHCYQDGVCVWCDDTDLDRAAWLADRAGLRQSPERLAWIAACVEMFIACRREGMEAVYANR